MSFTIASNWDAFYASTLLVQGITTKSVQYREMRKAYYAGFLNALLGLRDTVGRDDVPEDIGIAQLQGLHDEAITFFNDVKKGLA